MKRYLNRNKFNVILLLITLGTFIFLWIKDILIIGPYDHYSIISTNAIFAGFLYTGLGIVVSVLDKNVIKYLDRNGYMDGYINGIIIGLLFHVLSLVITFIIMLFNLEESLLNRLHLTGFVSMLIGVVFFIKSVFNIMKLINIVRKDNHK